MFKSSQRGVSLYIAVLIMVILLAIVLGMSAILFKQIKMMKKMGDSVIALYAADTGVEKVLKVIIYDPATPAIDYSVFLDFDDPPDGVPSGDCPDALVNDPEDACYRVRTYGNGENGCTAENWCIRSVGVYKGTRRAIEVGI